MTPIGAASADGTITIQFFRSSGGGTGVLQINQIEFVWNPVSLPSGFVGIPIYTATLFAGGVAVQTVTPQISTIMPTEIDYVYFDSLSTDVAYTAQVTTTINGVTYSSPMSQSLILPGPPGPPVNLSADNIGNGAVNLTWDAPSNGSAEAITSYGVTESPGSGYVCQTTSTTCTVSDLNAGITYTFYVNAVDADGTSANSNSAVVEEAAAPTTTTTTTIPVPRTITCYRGSISRKITRVNPVCPSGYSKTKPVKRTIVCYRGLLTKRITSFSPKCPPGYSTKAPAPTGSGSGSGSGSPETLYLNWKAGFEARLATLQSVISEYNATVNQFGAGNAWGSSIGSALVTDTRNLVTNPPPLTAYEYHSVVTAVTNLDSAMNQLACLGGTLEGRSCGSEGWLGFGPAQTSVVGNDLAALIAAVNS
jgi:hypothetical protein